jgi:hypothetical protein
LLATPYSNTDSARPNGRRKKMRRLMMLLGTVVLLALMASGVALAVIKTCQSIPCDGTNNADVLHERVRARPDNIFGFDGRDLLDANNRFADRDRLRGDAGSDKLLANDRDNRDQLRGGRGFDRCYGDPGDRFVNCNVRSTNAVAGLDVE